MRAAEPKLSWPSQSALAGVLLTLLAAAFRPSAAIVSFENQYAQSHWIPCAGFSRDCYPGFEKCYDRRYCLLNTWILLSLALLAILCYLTILLIFYFVLFKRGTGMICGIITLSVVAFLLMLAVLITVALHDSQEQLQPERNAKADEANVDLDEIDELEAFRRSMERRERA